MKKRLVALGIVTGLTLGFAGPAFAGTKPPPPPKDAKCNSGKGNLSETTPDNDCDPGKSFKNNGGD